MESIGITQAKVSTPVRTWRKWLVRVLIVLALAACQDRGPYAEAARIDSLDQAIGGPLALARVGDYLLENDQIRVIVEGGRSSRHPLDVGGSIIDADLQRPEARYRGGRGRDQLGQIMPVANMYVAQATVESQVRITRSRAGAEVTTATVGGVTVATLTFTGAESDPAAAGVNRSLSDGRFTLTVRGDQVQNSTGFLDGDGNGTAGGDRVVLFHRLFGDLTGEGTVNGADFNPFRVAFGSGPGNPNYLAAFDFDGDGFVIGSDFNQFRIRFGLSI